MRPISNVVDATNYVMLLTAQPLHAFDLDRLAGPEIVVRRARDGEPVTTLDGERRVLDGSMLAICDAERPQVIAGIMGAADAEVTAATERVLLEAASFSGRSILTTSLALGLRSESSARFEKGLPRELPARAMAIACRMLVELCGARLVPGTLDACEPIPARPPLRLRGERVERLLGIPVPDEESAAILGRLGCTVSQEAGALAVQVPFERGGDLTREVDLVEEVGRVHGIDRVPAALPRTATQGGRSPMGALVARLGRVAADLGLTEALTYRFVPEADLERLRLAADDPRRALVRIANPLSEEMAVMRRSLLPGLLRAAARNQSHQRPAGRLFETGRTFAPRPDGMADETERLAALLFGTPAREGWRGEPAPVDLYAATGLAAALARAARVAIATEPADEPFGHPTRQAWLRADGALVGWAGELHPAVLRAFDVAGPAAALDLDLDALLAARGGVPVYEDLVTTPVSTRDLALLVGEEVPAAAVLGVAREAGRPLVRDVRVFDRYAGEQVPAGKVSLAIRLTLADPEATLTDERIDAQVAAVAAALEARLGAELRR
jgi:phenylalanyl-tRNA synthetase beta chain